MPANKRTTTKSRSGSLTVISCASCASVRSFFMADS